MFISDHFQPWRHTGGHAPFSFAWMGALGARTSRIAIGTSVLTPTFRYHPSIVAQAFGTLGVMFPGRMILGIGTGESLNEVPATGMHWPEPKERIARLRESVKLIQQLWAEDRVSFAGEFYRTEKATIYDRPGKHVPIYIAGAGPLISKYAGADGRRLHLYQRQGARPVYATRCCRTSRQGCRPRGRPADSIDRMIEMKVSFDTDRDARARRTRATGRRLRSRPEEKMSVEDPLEMERLADQLPAERAAKRWIVSTDPDEHVEQNPPLRRARLPASGVPRAGPGPGAIPTPLFGTRAAQAASRSSADGRERTRRPGGSAADFRAGVAAGCSRATISRR